MGAQKTEVILDFLYVKTQNESFYVKVSNLTFFRSCTHTEMPVLFVQSFCFLVSKVHSPSLYQQSVFSWAVG